MELGPVKIYPLNASNYWKRAALLLIVVCVLLWLSWDFVIAVMDGETASLRPFQMGASPILIICAMVIIWTVIQTIYTAKKALCLDRVGVIIAGVPGKYAVFWNDVTEIQRGTREHGLGLSERGLRVNYKSGGHQKTLWVIFSHYDVDSAVLEDEMRASWKQNSIN